MKKQFVIDVAVILLLIMFLYASFSKLFDFAAFQRAMHKQPFPHWFASLLTFLIPAIEIGVCIFLYREKTRKNGLWAAAVLMLLFTVYVAAILLHLFKKVPCSCGGVISRLDWGEHLEFNVCFLLLAGIGLILQYKVENKIGG
ncbi:hypothetical protein DIU31_028300 [Mucilaginibacter rubeus]|uniref:Methylamine utilisation protein MauE domain-containing protein n=1 Tax=Mucilaginibacter rubeus TaxID=2027860 RepID=A0AAE6JKF7_9SPHI|nr:MULTISPECIES: MauE/DoxX family redox-associated membrane protein [Mucilaginibacter]QEM07210.1 hypothetical protein DIU31_028300 [Mucilaginibacter rubeus]QEM19666.1 hypothetical protein DIU38_027875 [Mucilaginibacter gossypii]QTE43638.1 hypothetical protein J3L19_32755 [Mucilaginibacter rubeus]QTE50238.1 hypothetical protein J3L21_32710 [Mucilaginibacter rubeus]QTE55326.1 hypothetical protein J3L23_24330 [Mucilaginibacter rubeus]